MNMLASGKWVKPWSKQTSSTNIFYQKNKQRMPSFSGFQQQKFISVANLLRHLGIFPDNLLTFEESLKVILSSVKKLCNFCMNFITLYNDLRYSLIAKLLSGLLSITVISHTTRVVIQPIMRNLNWNNAMLFMRKPE